MTLTVRLDTALESALERYCAERGVTKSLVVQESLATYLLADQAGAGRARPASADTMHGTMRCSRVRNSARHTLCA